MIQYILEVVTIQLVFLLVYDFFLKKETFFQWNRAYLLATFMLSLVLPWVKIEALKTSVPEKMVEYQAFLWQLDEAIFTVEKNSSFWDSVSWQLMVFAVGALFMSLWFGMKLSRLYLLKKRGSIQYYSDFTKITVLKSSMAFSFFKNVFLGDNISEVKQKSIIAHEMVHVKQWHSLDLMFFELMRIAFWFNPLVYLYQSRVSELHEFIADAKASKMDKKKQYEALLSEVFQSQSFSLVNQFFKQSLIKKRIVMLTKEKSKTIYQFKYALLLPLVLGMLFYTSCGSRKIKGDNEKIHINNKIEPKESSKELIANWGKRHNDLVRERNELLQSSNPKKDSLARVLDLMIKQNRYKMDEEMLEMNRQLAQKPANLRESTNRFDGSGPVPFAVIEEVPVFPGCEDATDRKECFREKLQEHIRKNFRYPEEAHKQGIQGRVNVIFIISKDGSITDFRKRGPHKLLEDEAERIINLLPKMQPGRQKGHLVEVPFSIPITFKLQGPKVDTSVQKPMNKSIKGMKVSGKLNESDNLFIGKVLDEDGLALPGVNINIKGTERGAVSDFDGNFRLQADKGDVLVIQFIGMPSIEYTIKK